MQKARTACYRQEGRSRRPIPCRDERPSRLCLRDRWQSFRRGIEEEKIGCRRGCELVVVPWRVSWTHHGNYSQECCPTRTYVLATSRRRTSVLFGTKETNTLIQKYSANAPLELNQSTTRYTRTGLCYSRREWSLCSSELRVALVDNQQSAAVGFVPPPISNALRFREKDFAGVCGKQ